MGRMFDPRSGLVALALVSALVVTGCVGAAARAPVDTGNLDLAKAKAELMAGDPAAAEKALTRSLGKKDSAEGRYYLALIETGKSNGDRAAALAEIKRSISLKPSAPAFLLKGALLEESDVDGAISSYQLGLAKASPGGLTEALLNRNTGLAFSKQGVWDKAHSHFEAYVAWATAKGRQMSDGERAFRGLLLYRAGDETKAKAAWDGIRDETLRRSVTDAAAAIKPSYGIVANSN